MLANRSSTRGAQSTTIVDYRDYWTGSADELYGDIEWD